MMYQRNEVKTRTLAGLFFTGLLLAASGCSDDDDSGSYTPPDDGNGNGSDELTETPFTPGNTESTDIGEVLANDNGMTLYVFEDDRNDADGDGEGDSDCNDTCADNWPPVVASEDDEAQGQFDIITRDDGSTLQWTFKGMPLYHYAGDSMAGDTTGEGLNDAWYVARPDPWMTNNIDDTTGTIYVGARDVADVMSGGGKADTRSDKSGFALYIFEADRDDVDGDGEGDSDCNDACAEAWPPLYAEPGATPWGQFTIIERDDGTMQWAFKGLPLYFFVNDTAAGDVNGDGINGFGGDWWLARPDPFQTADSDIGTVLAGATDVPGVDGSGNQASTRTDRDGFTLYVFDNDVNDTDGDGAGDSDCNGGCAVNWPPLYADPGSTPTGNYSIIERDDGSMQWAYEGEPLYFFANDSAAGDVDGDQVGDVWHAARTAPVQLFNDGTYGDIFAARGEVADVDSEGGRAETSSDKTGYTLYTFEDDANDADEDGMGDSDCNDQCAVDWPPLYAEEDDMAAGDFTIIERDDGTMQWAYDGQPLYFFNGDDAPGVVNGVYDTWHEVTP